MAIVLMLRPSDIAPRGKHVAPGNVTPDNIVFSTDHLKTLEDGSMVISFFGTKNDSNRTGFESHMPPASDICLDPCTALRDYISRTDSVRPKPSNPVFLTLRKPFKALDASTISDIMNESIKLAGLDGQGFSAKSFRPTGATIAIERHQDPARVMRTGRWKTESVFFDHYVHAKNQDDYSDHILGVVDSA
jgi:hypothetical protein